jgi:hypothetical protein
MLAGIQLLGIIFSLFMIYLAYVYYKRKNYGLRSFVIWLCVWLAALFLVSLPKTVYGVMQLLQIERTADFIVIMGFAFFSVIIFYIYTTVKKNNYKIEQLVRQLAINEQEQKETAKANISNDALSKSKNLKSKERRK